MWQTAARRPHVWLVATVALLVVLDVAMLGLAPSSYGLRRPTAPVEVADVVPAYDDVAAVRVTHLVVVAGHAVYVGPAAPADPTAAVHDEANWALEPHQHGQVPAFLDHVRVGLQLGAADERVLVVLSGGQTRRAAGPRSEAASYRQVARLLGWWNLTETAPGLPTRVALEEYARDSFENVLFSLCRFREVTGAYPEEVTVVSFAFKEYRFCHLHRAAVRFPAARFHFVQGSAADVDILETPAGEVLGARAQFEQDPFGCAAPLATKRAARDPFGRAHNYVSSCPEMRLLLRWCEDGASTGPLPWTTD